jgi:hypothetical protein
VKRKPTKPFTPCETWAAAKMCETLYSEDYHAELWHIFEARGARNFQGAKSETTGL